jgi:hypothetical protein
MTFYLVQHTFIKGLRGAGHDPILVTKGKVPVLYIGHLVLVYFSNVKAVACDAFAGHELSGMVQELAHRHFAAKWNVL